MKVYNQTESNLIKKIIATRIQHGLKLVFNFHL
jgi:hypothetical protein